MPKTDLPLNEAETHVRTIAPSGVPWECPVDFWPTAKEQGYKLATDESWAAALDERAEVAEKQAAAEAELVGGGTTANDDTSGSGDGDPNEFDPSAHSVTKVNEHLALHVGDQAEVDRVLAAEAADKNRSTVQAPDPAA